jgi:hypothetical protein
MRPKIAGSGNEISLHAKPGPLIFLLFAARRSVVAFAPAACSVGCSLWVCKRRAIR